MKSEREMKRGMKNRGMKNQRDMRRDLCVVFVSSLVSSSVCVYVWGVCVCVSVCVFMFVCVCVLSPGSSRRAFITHTQTGGASLFDSGSEDEAKAPSPAKSSVG